MEPISKLKSMAEIEHLEDRNKRLAQIRLLPLERMTCYCKDLPSERGKIECLLCPGSRWNAHQKDEWASSHFRLCHWCQYLGMIPNGPHLRYLQNHQLKEIVPWRKQIPPQCIADSRFSGDKWITQEDVIEDGPIYSDKEIAKLLKGSSFLPHYLAGPVMIQRFVVVREGDSYCLCLGIHTYARRGCGSQPDQELFSVISSEKHPPSLQPNETGVVLSPVRMKPDHPSIALPSTAMIHYGRAYEINFNLHVQPLGLIHPGSMETLLNRFESQIMKINYGETKQPQYQTENEAERPDSKIQPANMSVVKEMRESITRVLGPKISPVDHQPPSESSVICFIGD